MARELEIIGQYETEGYAQIFCLSTVTESAQSPVSPNALKTTLMMYESLNIGEGG